MKNSRKFIIIVRQDMLLKMISIQNVHAEINQRFVLNIEKIVIVFKYKYHKYKPSPAATIHKIFCRETTCICFGYVQQNLGSDKLCLYVLWSIMRCI